MSMQNKIDSLKMTICTMITEGLFDDYGGTFDNYGGAFPFVELSGFVIFNCVLFHATFRRFALLALKCTTENENM